MNNSLFLMAPPQNGGGGPESMIPTLIMFASIFAIMYFMMIRPQQKRQKELSNMLKSLQKGDKVVTSTGIHGTISEIDETTCTLEIANNVRVKFEKTAIATKKIDISL